MKQCFLVAYIVTLFSGCVVKEEPEHHHHDRVYIEESRPIVEEKIRVN